MTSPAEIDPNEIALQWHWLLWDCIEFFGVEKVWAVGLESLGYPPTWSDTKQEADLVEAALLKSVENKL